MAWIGAAMLLSVGNAVQLERHMSAQLRLITRMRAHALDLSLLMLLATVVAAVAWATSGLARRWAASHANLVNAILLLIPGGGLGAWLLRSDFANFIGQHELKFSPTLVGTILGGGYVLALVGARQYLAARRLNAPSIALGLTLGYLNADLLAGDYPGLHLCVLLTALALISSAIQGHCERLWLGRNIKIGSMILLVLLGLSIAIVGAPAPRSVRQALANCASTPLAPHSARYLPKQRVPEASLLPLEASDWFHPRPSSVFVAPAARPPVPPNAIVLLFTIDALRADVLRDRQHDATLPTLARIRDASLSFASARSPSPSTLTTVTALFTGKYYSQIYFTEDSPGKVLPLRDTSKRVPKLLSDARVTTVHVRALHGIGQDSGVGRGFDEEPRTANNYGHATDVIDIVLATLERFRSAPERRMFLYSHFVDSHAPYTLGGKRATPFESYLAELELVDQALSRLLSYLDEHHLMERCLLIVSADHGEAFGEHGMRFHARSVYDELLRVPLYFLNAHVHAGIDQMPVSLIDLSPTLLDWFGLAIPGDFMGESLVPSLLGVPQQPSRPIAADSGRRHQALFFSDGIKVIRDRIQDTAEVYDTVRDPKELADLTDNPKVDVEPYIHATDRFFWAHTLHIPGWEPPWRTF